MRGRSSRPGKDVFDPAAARLFRRLLYRSNYRRGHRALGHSGEYTGLAVYRLLGGKYRSRIPTYTGIGGRTIGDVKESALSATSRGFGAVKMSLSKGAGTSDLNRVLEVAEAIRGKGQLLVDSLGGYKLHEAVIVGREMDKVGNIGWWEDPLTPDDTEDYPKLADTLTVPIRPARNFAPVSVSGYVRETGHRHCDSVRFPGWRYHGDATDRGAGGRA